MADGNFQVEPSESRFLPTSSPLFPPPPPSQVTLSDLALTFSLLGMTCFGGGAVMGLIQDKVVRVKQWISNQEFIESVALGQSLPGPIGPNSIAHIGYRLQGMAGAAVSLVMFILPSFFLMVGFSIVYEYTRNVPAVSHLFFGLNPAVTGLVAGTAVRLGTSALQTRYQLGHALIVYGIAVAFPGMVFPIIFLSLVGGAIWGITSPKTIPPESSSISSDDLHPYLHRMIRVIALSTGVLIVIGLAGLGVHALVNNGSVADSFQRFSNWLFQHRLLSLAAIALKLGTFTFGGGYVMVPLMEHEVVTTHQWLSHREFMDGMALGQLTPGPVVITVTFIGYRVAGLPGALIATIGVFLMPFFFTVWAGKSLELFHRNRMVRGALAGVTPTAIALLAAAATSLGLTALVGPPLSQLVVISIIALSAAIFVRCKFNPLYILLAATGVGWFFAP